jgi:hypothetical protein
LKIREDMTLQSLPRRPLPFGRTLKKPAWCAFGPRSAELDVAVASGLAEAVESGNRVAYRLTKAGMAEVFGRRKRAAVVWDRWPNGLAGCLDCGRERAKAAYTGRGLCGRCYRTHTMAGDLGLYPLMGGQ